MWFLVLGHDVAAVRGLAGEGDPPVDELGRFEAAAHGEQLERERVTVAGSRVRVGVAALAVDSRDVGGAAGLVVGAGVVVGLQREPRDPVPPGDHREQRDEARRNSAGPEVVLLLRVQELDPRAAATAPVAGAPASAVRPPRTRPAPVATSVTVR